ncbi:MerR family transcriptional regulator [Faecalicatena contorta]|uniref:DNA-binding transcriptional regulator, MerR family n=1 Tax=Faecalicatena contorta TaxID=39482 RepID=A0A315ZUQ3_9FIRM|nr:MerR family transcriptional regulator [Faecalicatena contorta]PWJ49306.1 DNA-binding transcriptional MerR regulator [Faecalicatena contorta]SUQ14550.1 DNA-binding transcriptional regulator, MerR family [Faecalicatena contorta]
MNHYIKIKAFAELTGVSVRTLQYYDEINLLKPAHINEYGHRFYDSGSFSKFFVILSLKNMGMNLAEIHQYVNNNNFNIRVFIEEEMRRVEAEITDLQLRLMRLSRLNEQIEEKQDITPSILPFFSHVGSSTDVSQAQIDNLIKYEEEKLDFNIKSWNAFIKDLNFCFEKNLSSKDKKALKCIHYWKENVLEANKVDNDMVKLAEDFYQNPSQISFGITGDNYKYLIELIAEYDKMGV